MSPWLFVPASAVIAAVGLATSCRSGTVAGPDPQGLSEVLELAVGGSARIPSSNITIVFERVESDSRCPTGVTCVWAGDGVVQLKVGASSQTSASLMLHTHESGSREARHAGYLIRLVELLPYPASEVPIDPATYRVRLIVST